MYHLLSGETHLYEPGRNFTRQDSTIFASLADPALEDAIGTEMLGALRAELELVEGASHAFDAAAYLAGEQTPVFSARPSTTSACRCCSISSSSTPLATGSPAKQHLRPVVGQGGLDTSVSEAVGSSPIHITQGAGRPALPAEDAMKVLRSKQVIQATGLSRMTIWRLEKAGKFPARRRLGTHAVGWLEGDVELWISSRASVQPLSQAGAP